MVPICNPSLLLRRQRQKNLKFEASLGQKLGRLQSQKENTNKRTGGMVEVIEHYPSMHEQQQQKLNQGSGASPRFHHHSSPWPHPQGDSDPGGQRWTWESAFFPGHSG
jgi:hypothetical protein